MFKLLQGTLCLLFLGINWSFPKTTLAQFEVPTNSSFYTFQDSFYHYPQDDSTEGGMYNKMRRATRIWGPRLAPDGRMSRANQAMLAYTRAYMNLPAASGGGSSQTIPIVLPNSYPAPVNWGELGHLTPLLGGNASNAKGMGQVQRLAFHPNYNGSSNQIIYAGSHYGGLYRIDKIGGKWYNYYTDRGLPMTSVGDVAASASYVFVCTGNGDHASTHFGAQADYAPIRGNINDFSPIHTQGVYRNTHTNPSSQWISINGTQVSLLDGSTAGSLLEVFEQGGTMRRIIVHPTNEQILLIATSQGIFRTGNGGNTWQQVLVGPVDSGSITNYEWETAWRGLEFHPTNPNIVYASAKDVYKSTDGGLTWASMTNGQGFQVGAKRTNITVTPAAPDRVYAYAVADSGYVFLYENGAWTAKGTTSNSAKDWVDIAVSPVYQDVVHVTGITTGATHNFDVLGAASFTSFGGGGIHADVHYLGYPPNGDTVLFAGTHGGVSRCTTLAHYSTAWENMYEGLGITLIYSFDDWEGDDSLLITANQDIGINHTYDRGATWRSDLSGLGDGYGVRINDQTGNAYLKGTSYRGGYHLYPHLHSFYNSFTRDFYSLHRKPRDTSYTPQIFSYPWVVQVPNTFPAVNHPKDEGFYMGFSELFLRKNDVMPVQDIPYTIDTTDTWIMGNVYDSNWVFVRRPPSAGTCPAPNIILALDTIHRVQLNRFRVDTLCRNITTSTINTTSYPYFWKRASDLAYHHSSGNNRRILEIAFSEDEQTDYSYLVTLGDILHRRCDLYVQDKRAACDTCFIKKTTNLPIDNTVPNWITQDPNPITGIAVDPLNGNRVWVTFSGYSKDLKVWYSEDAGDSWTSWDDSTNSLAGLNVPINNIVYQRETKDRLYIATDVGIYVREGTGPWLRYGEAFPNVRVTELKINYCVGKLRAATFGRGMWEADLLPVEKSIAYRSFRTVDTNETWTTDKHLSRDIKVKAGATLHLQKMTLNMPKDGLIVIEPGGQLFVDSSTITNLCGQTWQGIEVWGNTHLEQYPATNQGELLVINSTIEHAKEAISPWQVGNFPKADGTGGTGGIVRAAGSHFKNNWRSVGFMKYHAPSTAAREASRFIDCTFEVDDDLRQDFLGHLSAWDINQLRVEGCQFRDQRSNKTGDGYGIFTLSASIHLTAQAPNPVNLTFERNSFEGLSRGVVLGSTPNKGSIVVDQTDFVDNQRGVIVRASGGLKVLRNSFEIGNHTTTHAATPYGLSILRQGDFVAEQNDFQGAANMPSGRVSLGFWVDDLGSGFNEIRSNTFTSLDIANLAHGNSGADNNNQFGGVQYLCNGQTGNAFDITVNKAFQAPTGAAIGANQGDNNQPAYNSFSYPLSSDYGIEWHMSNDASILPKINYWTPPSPVQIEEPTDTINIDVLRASGIGVLGFCDLRYTNLGVFKPLESNGDLATMQNLKADYYQVWGEYQQLLEDYEDDTNSTTLPGQIGGKGQELTNKANEVIFYYRNDTTDSYCDSIAIWIQNKVGLSAEYELVEHYWSCGQFSLALSHLSSITDNYTLTGVVLDNHQDYGSLLNLLYMAYQDNRTEAILTKDEVIALNEWAENNYGFAAMKAANIVDFFYTDTYRYHPTLPEGGEKSLQESMTKVEKGNLAIYPNPTTTWADISYKLPEEVISGRLVVTSTSGQQMVVLEVSEQQGTLTLNTSHWLTGTYFVILYTEEEAVEQTQLIIR